ncbi:hypothetical protein VN0227_06360 [Helicobacter pylori]|nr:hypothetical protein VN0227_06360 [Helicobacter pylori]
MIKIFALNGVFCCSKKKKKKKKRFFGVLETFFNIKKGLKSGLIGIAVKMEIHLLGGIILDRVVKLKESILE